MGRAGRGWRGGDHSPKPRLGADPGRPRQGCSMGRGPWGKGALAEWSDDKSQRTGREFSEGRESGAARTLATDVKSSGPRKGRPGWAFKWKRIGQSFVS